MTPQYTPDPLQEAIQHLLKNGPSGLTFAESGCLSTNELSQLVLGSLPPQRLEEVQRHLAGCVYCRAGHFTLKAFLLDELIPDVPGMHQEDPRITEWLREVGYDPDGPPEV